MAFYEDENEENQDPNNQSYQTSAQAGTVGANAAAGQGSNGPAPKAAGSPDSPGNFVGIQQYLNANKPQAEKLGTQVSGVINQSAQGARDAVGALEQEGADKIKGTENLSDDVKSKLQNNAESLTDAEKQIIKKTQTATYQGPQNVQSLQSYQAASDASNKAKQNIENSGTEQGRMGLLSQVNNKPRTQGMNVFDNALLQAGGGREKLAQASQSNQDVLGRLDQASTGIQNQIGRADDPNTPDIDESAGAIGQTNKAQSDAYNTVQTALSNWKNSFQPRLQTAQEDFAGLQNRVNQDLANDPYMFDQETMDLLGLKVSDSLYDLDLKNYLNPGSPSDINAANFASNQDYARYGALADLAGETNLMLNPENMSQASTAPQFGADKDRLAQDLVAKATQYKNEYQVQPATQVLGNFLAQYPDLEQVFPGISRQPIALLEQTIAPYGGPGASAWERDAYNAIQSKINAWKSGTGISNTVNPLPTNPDGTINWGGTGDGPTGGAGKGGVVLPTDDDLLKKKGKA